MDTRNMLLAVLVAVLLLTATASAVPRPNITRHQFFSSALTGVVAIGVNKSTTIWCSARNRVRFMGLKKLRQLFLVYNSKKLVPAVDRGQSSDFDVYMEHFAGSYGVDNATWHRVLHFKRAQPSSAGSYTCVATYQGNILSRQSVEIRVSDIDCGDPGTPTNGDRHPFSTVYTSEVLYQCSMGYTLQGSDRRTCQSDGEWSGHLPQCNSTDCGDPGTPTNGQRSLSSTTYNSVVTYTCDVDYTLQGSNSRTCQSSGQWSGSVPQCSDIDCGDPGTPTNGDHHPFSTVYTSEVLYYCSTGYTLQGSDRRTCQSDGQWSGHLPQCNPIDCGDPGTPTNGQRSLSSTTYNSVVTYTCDVGYTLQGANRRTCQADGQWSGSVPQCNGKGISSTTSGTSPTSSGTSNSGTGSAAVIASVVVIVLLLLGCVSVIVITVVVIYRRHHSSKTFSPTELYQSKMESFPLAPENEVKFVGDVTTNRFSWPCDAVGQAGQADKETEFEDSHSITEADGEVSVVAVADSTQLSDETERSDALSDQLDEEAQPGSGCEAARAYEANNFVEHVKKMHKERDRGFEEEFKKIIDDPNGIHDVAIANRSKNRYHNVHTFDHSRVVLSEIDEQGSDYINASYINGEHGDTYIASQGPTPETVSDFWQMIWDVQPAVIVMLTKVNENGRRKCEQYWNEQLDKPYDAGRGFTVVTTGYRGFADYVVRDMTLTRSTDEHDGAFCLKQFQYTGWPDHGVPCQSSSLVKFIQQVRKEFEGTGAPIVVHCSAGVGRTGTYISLDAMMERLKERDDSNIFECVSIFEFVSEMRTQRMKMVQTLDQYVFIHDALCDYITCGDTSVPAHELKAAIATFMRVNKNTKMTGFQEQFDMLEKLSKTPCPEDIAFAKKMVVAKRNRYKDRFPYFANYLRLPYSSASNGTDYFNASFMNSYSGRRAFIAAQSPMAQTRNDIWELIWQFRISTIVLLCELREENQDTCYPFWPDERMGTFDWKIVKVNYKTTVPMKGCDKVLLDVFNNSKLASPPMEAVLYHIRGWTTTGPPPAASLLAVMGEVAELQKEKVGPVLVMCDDGMSRSGVFITCMSEIERVKVEGGVDIFQTVKAARAQRPHMVYTSEQYKMCFEILQSYLELYDTYANYKDV